MGGWGSYLACFLQGQLQLEGLPHRLYNVRRTLRLIESRSPNLIPGPAAYLSVDLGHHRTARTVQQLLPEYFIDHNSLCLICAIFRTNYKRSLYSVFSVPCCVLYLSCILNPETYFPKKSQHHAARRMHRHIHEDDRCRTVRRAVEHSSQV